MKVAFLNKLSKGKVVVDILNRGTDSREFFFDSVKRKENRIDFYLNEKLQSSLKLTNCSYFEIDSENSCSWQYKSPSNDDVCKYVATKE